MSITLLVVAVAAVTLSAAYVVATSTKVAEPVLAGEQTMVGLADPAAETLTAGNGGPRTGATWHLATVDDLTDAEHLLDCLEAQGFSDRELVVLGNSSFAVRWR